LVNIRNHVPGLDTVWADQRLQQACISSLEFISCDGVHVSDINFNSKSWSGSSTGTLGNITGLRFLKTLAFGYTTEVLDLDAWYTQLPSLTALSFTSTVTPKTFTANFTQNPLLTAFFYRDYNTSVIPWKISGAPGLKSLTISAQRLSSSLSSDFLTGLSLTYLSFATTGSYTNLRVFPDFSNLTNLESLDFTQTNIDPLPDTFTNLVNLKLLILTQCNFVSKIPQSVRNCVKLESLLCESCRLNRADSLPNMSSLRLKKLSLYGNSIQKVWPDGLCQLPTNPAEPGLSLDLSGNAVSDPPACFANTSKLYDLRIGSHNFTTFPTYLASMPSLAYLYISCHRPMVGAMPDISGLPFLDSLDLTNCGLVGNFPSALPTTLKYAHLNGNNLTGTIRDNLFAGLSSLSFLHIADNHLSGAFPSSIGNTRLTSLKASNNAFTSLPSSIGQIFPNTVDFHNNNLSSIPSDEVWAKTKPSLNELFLHNNRYLTGPLPVFWSKRGSNVRSINLSGCSFTGSVPPLNSTRLYSVILSDNALDGTIMPSELARGINTFKVDRNRLTGTIPPSFGIVGSQAGLSDAAIVDFSNNRLTGSIPSTFQQLFDKGTIREFYFNNNGIEGPLPNLTLAKNLLIFKGDHTKVRLCEANPNIRAGSQCTLTDVAFPGACGCESWYATCITTNVDCLAPDYVVPVDPPGTSAPTPILPPGSDPIIPTTVLPPYESVIPHQESGTPHQESETPYGDGTPSPTEGPVSSVQNGSSGSISTSFALFVLVSAIGSFLL